MKKKKLKKSTSRGKKERKYLEKERLKEEVERDEASDEVSEKLAEDEHKMAEDEPIKITEDESDKIHKEEKSVLNNTTSIHNTSNNIYTNQELLCSRLNSLMKSSKFNKRFDKKNIIQALEISPTSFDNFIKYRHQSNELREEIEAKLAYWLDSVEDEVLLDDSLVSLNPSQSNQLSAQIQLFFSLSSGRIPSSSLLLSAIPEKYNKHNNTKALNYEYNRTNLLSLQKKVKEDILYSRNNGSLLNPLAYYKSFDISNLGPLERFQSSSPSFAISFEYKNGGLCLNAFKEEYNSLPNSLKEKEPYTINHRKNIHSFFLQCVELRQREIQELSLWKIKTRASLARSAGNAVAASIRRKQAQADRLKHQRMQLLKENNIEEYTKMVKEHHDSRLQTLLDQTDSYLTQLGIRVQAEKSSNESFSSKITSSSSDSYYQIAHSIQEDVSPPSNLTGGTLKDYQIEGLKWLVSLYNNNLHGILADEMGLGKTIMIISLIAFLIEKKNVEGPFLISVPLSTISNWMSEFEKWAPSISVIQYLGSPSSRKSLWKNSIHNSKFNVLLTSYEYIIHPSDKHRLSSIKWKYIIIDEGQRMKNSQSLFSQSLSNNYTSSYRLILTGTPLQNSLSELWSLLNFLLPSIFDSVDNFEDWFNKPFQENGFDNFELNEEEKLLIINRLHQVLRPFILRRLKKYVASSLPDKIERVLKCELSALQKEIYKQITHKCLFEIDSNTGKMGVRSMSNTMMQLRKICNHPYLFQDDWEDSEIDQNIIRASGKFELLDRMLDKLIATKHRTLIFSQMTSLLDILEAYLRWKSIEYLRLDGSTPPLERSSLISKFNQAESPYYIFLLSTRAGGLGLNLQTADTVIIFDSDWNPQMDIQAQSRAHRIGQTNEVRVFRLVTQTPFEEHVLHKAARKLELDSLVIQSGKFSRSEKEGKDEEREETLREILRKGIDFGEEIEAPNDEQLNSFILRSDDSIGTETEMGIYSRIDEERSKRLLSEGWKFHLMQDDEISEYIKINENEDYDSMKKKLGHKSLMGEVDTEAYGRGRRFHSNISYDERDLAEGRRKFKNERPKRKERDESYEKEHSGIKRKKGRPRKVQSPIIIASDNEVSIDLKSFSITRRKRRSSDQNSALILQILTTLYDTFDENDEAIINLLEAPMPTSNNPSFENIIESHSGISFSVICEKVQNDEYNSVDLFVRDLDKYSEEKMNMCVELLSSIYSNVNANSSLLASLNNCYHAAEILKTTTRKILFEEKKKK